MADRMMSLLPLCLSQPRQQQHQRKEHVQLQDRKVVVL